MKARWVWLVVFTVGCFGGDNNEQEETERGYEWELPEGVPLPMV